MAITTSAGDGVRITSPSWCGVATGTQASCYVRVNGRWAAGGNTNNGNTSGSFASFTDRLVLLRKGTCTEETRYVTSCTPCAGADTTQLFVHEPWCVNPSACDTVDVSYIIQDAATVTGLGLINKRVQDYSSTRKFRIGNAGCAPAFAYFALLNGASLETVDNSSTTCPDLRVENNGRFSNGFVANGAGTGGGYVIGTPAVAGELVFETVSGAQLDWQYNLFFTNVNAPEFRINGVCTSGTVKMNNVFGTRQLQVDSPNINYNCISVVGKNDACDYIDFTNVRCGETYTFTNLNIDSVRLGNAATVGTQSNTFNIINFNVQRPTSSTPSIINVVDACAAWTTTWNVVNPKWSVTGSCELALDTACSVVSEQFRQNVTVQTPSGSKVNGAISNHISTRCSTAAIRITTSSNACGLAILDTESRRWTGTCETLASSTLHGLQVHDYCKTSFATVPTLTNKTDGFGQCLTVAIDTDPFVCGETECQAKTFTTQPTIIGPSTNPNSIIKFTSGSGTLTVGKWVGVCNGSCAPTIYGKVKEINEGCSTAGTVILTDRSTGNFTTSLVEYECSACAPSATKLDWTGSLTACSQKCFTYLYCVGAKTACLATTTQQAYNHQKAKLHECPIDTADNWDDAKIWGVGQHANFMQGVDSNASPKTFRTVRNTTNAEGWAITGLAGLGSIVEYTSDDGSVFTPQSTVQIKVTVLEAEDFTTPIACARVHVENTAGTTTYLNTLTNACGVASACIIYTGDVSVFVRARKEVEEYVKVPTVISSSGFNISIAVKDDPLYTPT